MNSLFLEEFLLAKYRSGNLPFNIKITVTTINIENYSFKSISSNNILLVAMNLYGFSFKAVNGIE